MCIVSLKMFDCRNRRDGLGDLWTSLVSAPLVTFGCFVKNWFSIFCCTLPEINIQYKIVIGSIPSYLFEIIKCTSQKFYTNFNN